MPFNLEKRSAIKKLMFLLTVIKLRSNVWCSAENSNCQNLKSCLVEVAFVVIVFFFSHNTKYNIYASVSRYWLITNIAGLGKLFTTLG